MMWIVYGLAVIGGFFLIALGWAILDDVRETHADNRKLRETNEKLEANVNTLRAKVTALEIGMPYRATSTLDRGEE